MLECWSVGVLEAWPALTDSEAGLLNAELTAIKARVGMKPGQILTDPTIQKCQPLKDTIAKTCGLGT